MYSLDGFHRDIHVRELVAEGPDPQLSVQHEKGIDVIASFFDLISSSAKQWFVKIVHDVLVFDLKHVERCYHDP
jgi:hypothetical protein